MTKAGTLRPTGPLHRTGSAAITVLLTLASLIGCSDPADENPPTKSKQSTTGSVATSTPSGRASPIATPRGGAPDPDRVDHNDPTAVSKAAVTTMWSVDAAIDAGQRDAYRRARPYLTPQYFATVASETSGKLPNAWQEHRAYAAVRLTPQQVDLGAGPDTSTTAHRQWGITVAPTGRDGWKGSKVEAVAFVTLTRASPAAPWRVSAVTTG